ncbi:uncharacterized protein A1O9_05252 [Exophiala aquamarina CBS 119918]|uniref:Uncharacterized protein n=1 Tax=Exophiala aquamarina CBS 119918 TaxID=1182545 RepID=A0A072PPC3_9EURO|nr:uncharacterized protein A1O9_05252 [Exophiala aquamarina CBS 119918]KEF57335.1 hypothetical protein A1O9_05252 [Exophiala aquamarina CBS 119918]
MATPKTLSQFSPPAFLTDIKPENVKAWSDIISGWMDDEIAGRHEGRTPLKQFFNGTETPYDQSADHVNITWFGFPKKVIGSDEQRWKKAESTRMVQDEYLEWSVLRDEAGSITSATFTCEGPEYWEFLGKHQPEETFELIKKINSPLLDNAEMDWFFKKDHTGNWEFDRNNKFNNTTSGGTIISLWQPNNTLSAEIDIAAQGTVIRQSHGKIIDSSDQLIKCSRYGDPDRNSDPAIGAAINQAARKGNTLSVADPVALYMQSFDTSNLSLDTSGNRDGTAQDPIPSSWIELQRGSALGKKVPLGLRLRIRNNTGAKTADGSRLLDVSDIWDDSTQNNIRYAAQFADHIKMGVAGVLGSKIAQPTVADALPCVGSSEHASLLAKAAPNAHTNGHVAPRGFRM